MSLLNFKNFFLDKEKLFFYDNTSFLIIYGKVVRISISEQAFTIDAPENIDGFFLFFRCMTKKEKQKSKFYFLIHPWIDNK